MCLPNLLPRFVEGVSCVHHPLVPSLARSKVPHEARPSEAQVCVGARRSCGAPASSFASSDGSHSRATTTTDLTHHAAATVRWMSSTIFSLIPDFLDQRPPFAFDTFLSVTSCTCKCSSCISDHAFFFDVFEFLACLLCCSALALSFFVRRRFFSLYSSVNQLLVRPPLHLLCSASGRCRTEWHLWTPSGVHLFVWCCRLPITMC